MIKLIIAAFYLVSCANSGTYDTYKDYNFHVKGGTPAQIRLIKGFVLDLNGELQIRRFHYTDDITQANAIVSIEEDEFIEESPSTVGLGRPTYVFTERGKEYGMEIWIRESAYSAYIDNNESYYIRSIFYHEVGHGLYMDHSTKVKDLMNSVVPKNNVDYTDYREKAKIFFQNSLSFPENNR